MFHGNLSPRPAALLRRKRASPQGCFGLASVPARQPDDTEEPPVRSPAVGLGLVVKKANAELRRREPLLGGAVGEKRLNPAASVNLARDQRTMKSHWAAIVMC